eukprot:TRINITY_DN6914_c0_g1_i1.p1 TRINITY_DN6914_c0_g1~~TRINITY_DN6914_c0_g1_i1.p1  ORF type:complete len:136 (-),score=39.53 TRINITY_DN6914_c0_g1_i1:11-394(-)
MSSLTHKRCEDMLNHIRDLSRVIESLSGVRIIDFSQDSARFTIESCGKSITMKITLALNEEDRLVPVAATMEPPLLNIQDIVEYAHLLGDISIIIRETKARLRSRHNNVSLAQTDLSSRSMARGVAW